QASLRRPRGPRLRARPAAARGDGGGRPRERLPDRPSRDPSRARGGSAPLRGGRLPRHGALRRQPLRPPQPREGSLPLAIGGRPRAVERDRPGPTGYGPPLPVMSEPPSPSPHFSARTERSGEGVLVVRLAGELDIATAPVARAELLRAVRQGP